MYHHGSCWLVYSWVWAMLSVYFFPPPPFFLTIAGFSPVPVPLLLSWYLFGDPSRNVIKYKKRPYISPEYSQ
ncbi:hypothetical protein GGS23DRAFT_579510 [Durotheca rogersii]|uniref:uncharacterized protein n=1 Tax=Durotheca rogersii TaxID=419775 RepID=UPI00221E8573|nr:uncharacterized protein GGS23DRAFT_579510 [Durotheca rogersii]KAI5860918.1 hypothetical protein GGS23DRAFT_579510 [Durotheca rogersii]